MFRMRFFSVRSISSLSIYALIASLIFVPNFAFSAQIKAGAPCKTLNSKVTQSGKLYTCIKKGNKLVWSNGVAIKSAAPSNSTSPLPKTSPTPSASTTPTKIDNLSKDSRITNASLLTNVSTCKTVDNTPDSGNINRNGFPRPKDNLYPSGKVKVLVIPFNYKTWNFRTVLPQGANQTMTDLDLLKSMSKELEQFYKESSGGRFELSVTVLPEKEWWTMDPDLTFSTGEFAENFGPILKMIEMNDGKIDFTAYDSYIFISSLPAAIPPVAQAMFTSDLMTSKGKANKLVAITAGWQNYPLVFHELGHSLFGLEDLYLRSASPDESPAEWLPKDLKVPMTWEIMADSKIAKMTNWNRLLMGWIRDDEIRCITNQADSVHYLSNFPTENQPKILLINLEPGVTLAAETRDAGTSQGLLLYIIDTNLAHATGPVRALEYLLKAGDSKELFDWKFDVLETSKDGLLVKVSKGLGKKYVAPPRQNNQNQGGVDVPRPTPRTGEVVQTSYLKGRFTWDTTNKKSYRIVVTPFDDPKKILFDSGVVNTTTNQTVVEISGLICGKELVTTMQFWSERDGKGAVDQASTGQLGKFECKS